MFTHAFSKSFSYFNFWELRILFYCELNSIQIIFFLFGCFWDEPSEAENAKSYPKNARVDGAIESNCFCSDVNIVKRTFVSPVSLDCDGGWHHWGCYCCFLVRWMVLIRMAEAHGPLCPRRTVLGQQKNLIERERERERERSKWRCRNWE